MIKLLSLFSGIGAPEKALKNLGIAYDLVGYSEIDKHASKAYAIIHDTPETKNLGDITKVDPDALPEDIDLITYGFPCVPKGYSVKTKDGYKNIEDITNNDQVLTHTNTYKSVVKTMRRISDHINHIKCVGCADLQVTDEHPLYVLRDNKFVWIKAKDLSANTDMLTFNINKQAIKCDLSDNVLWLLGRYFADGYKENHSLHRPILCIGKNKRAEFEQHIKDFAYTIAHDDRPAVEYKIIDDKLSDIFADITTGSSNKAIPQWIIDLPKDQLKHFYDGYFSGDGHSRKDRNTKMFCTVSKNMFLALQDIVIKLYGIVPTVSIRHDNRKESFNDTYNAQYSPNCKDQIIKDDKVCVKIKSINREVKDIEVFNFEVAEDNSYTVDNIIVHNCQDISVAGKQRGFTDENGKRTRSGLFFEALRIIQDTRPKVAIAENVKALTGKKFAAEFKIVLDSLADAGYNNYWKVLNAKDYGIPQNRQRVFIVSIRKDIDKGYFLYPNKVPLTSKLRDVLEQNVDEKYYLRDDQIQPIILEKEVSNAIRVGGRGSIDRHTWDLVTEPNIGHNPVSKKLEFDGFRTDVSPCLIATDYKAPKCTMTQDMRIRKLTPKECWRLMGFADTDIDKCIAAGISNTQLYKQAGNSIVVNVLENLFKNILTILDR